MNKKIRVHTVMYKGCVCWSLRYADPVTGKQRRKSSRTENREEARKLARDWENDLNNGRDPGQYTITWAKFRCTYECQVVPGLAERTGRKINTVFNAVERILPKVSAGKLSDLNPQAISSLQAELRNGKLSENTISSYLAHLHSALTWAAEQEMILAAPKFKRPTRAKKLGCTSKARGRSITGEEFDRMLEKIPDALIADRQRRREDQRTGKRKPYYCKRSSEAITPERLNSWRHYMNGLWLSGLRLGESLILSWDDGSPFQVDFTGKYPRFRISAEAEKGHADRVLPLTPDFAEWLLATPCGERNGFVFNPEMITGRASYDTVGRVLSLTGELAGVKVHTDHRTGKVKFASAVDFRRSFGTRWAKKVKPCVLQKLMRHDYIQTTLDFYVDIQADDIGDILSEIECPA
jgi:integrase